MNIKYIRAGATAALDQAWLSAVSFAIAIAFVRWAEKTEYGLYILLLTPALLLQGIQNAIFISPFATIYPQASDDRQTPVLQTLIWGQFIFGLVAAILGFLGLLTYYAATGRVATLLLATAFSVGIVGIIIREGMRSLQYASGRSGAAFVGDLIYGLALLTALGIGVLSERLSTVWVFFGTGVAGALPLLIKFVKQNTVLPKISKAEAKNFWKCGRWALVGVILTWVNLNTYSYFSALSFGIDAVAELSVAKLFMMPVALCLPAWSNLMRPKFSYWASQSQWSLLKRYSIRSIFLGTGVLIIYIIAIAASYTFLESFLGKNYHSILPLILAWVIPTFFTFVRTVFMASLMVDEKGYKVLSIVSVLSTLIYLPIMGIAMKESLVAIVFGLALVELFQMLFVGYYTYLYWNKAQK